MVGPSLPYRFGSSFSLAERESGLARAASPQKIFDLLIVGGGITGAAMARDATLRGLRVLLVEKNDFAYGTSSRSSKLVHGGVRYLEQYEFKLVRESTRERARLWKLAPELVTPLPFLFPAFRGHRVPLWKLNIGLWLYDFLALFRLPGLHRLYSKKRTLQEESGLKAEGLCGSIFYWDGSTNDALLTLANVVDAHLNGAICLSRVEIEKINWQSRSPEGEAHTIQVKDLLAQKTFSVRARSVACATGPWTDTFLAKNSVRTGAARPLLAPTRGSHIVLPQNRLPTQHAITLFHPRDGRVLFTIPWGETTIIGTTDIFDEDSPDRTVIRTEEIDYLLEAANDYFPASRLGREDVLSSWSGLRPLLAPPTEASASKISREHHIEFEEPGLLVIAGGKLTTHREMAEQAVDKILKATQKWPVPLQKVFIPTTTLDRPLPAFEFPRKGVAAPRLGSSEASALSLTDIIGICRSQMVLSLEDLLVRRTAIFYKEKDNGWALLAKFKENLCRELQWDEKKWSAEKAAYRAYIDIHVNKPLQRPLQNPEI